MFFLPAVHRHPAFRVGIGDMLGVAPGIAAWGLMTGVAMVRAGMTPFEAMAMTLLVYAGSAQLASIPLIVAGAPAWIIWATAFCVNLRFVVFSLHLRDYLIHLPRWRRLVSGFLTADMTYAMFTKRYANPPANEAEGREQEAYLAGNYFTTWTGWCSASLLGVLLGHAIPASWGLGFAGVLCLVGVLCSLATTKLRAVAAVVAGVVAVAAYAMPLKLNVVIAIAAAVGLCFWLEGRLPGEKEAAA
jgi:predicted branched-subunit amino acid permease